MNISAIKAQITGCGDVAAVQAIAKHAHERLEELTGLDHQVALGEEWQRASSWPLGASVYRWSTPDLPGAAPRGTRATVIDINQRLRAVKLAWRGSPMGGIWIQPEGLLAMDWRLTQPPPGEIVDGPSISESEDARREARS